MKSCPECGYSNPHDATDCWKCNCALAYVGMKQFVPRERWWVGPQRAMDIRKKALAFAVLGLLLQVYWGGLGPLAGVSDPTLLKLKDSLQPLFTAGGLVTYAAGWVLRRV